MLSKDTNYTITFSMSAVRHCAEAMFLIVFANATCIFCHFSFVSRSQNVRPWNSSLRRKNCCLFPGSGYFSYTQSSSTEHYLGLEGSWVARGLDHGHWGRRMEFRGCLCVFTSPWSKVAYLFVRSNFQLEFYWRSSYSSLLFTMCNFCSFSAN